MGRLNRISSAVVLPIVLLVYASATPAATPLDKTAAVAPVGPIAIVYALHFAPEPKGDVAKQAGDLLQSKFPKLKRLSKVDERVDEPAVFIEMLGMKEAEIEPPSMESLKYYGRGVTRQQAEELQKSKVTAGVTFTYPAADVVAGLSQANAFIHELASRTAGLVWDVETRELYTPDAWSKSRMGAPDHGVLDVRDHITMHAYQADEYMRVITLGMQKFGLPDLVINEFSWSLNEQMGTTINLFAQSLLEGATPKLGNYDFDVSKTRHARVREVYENHLLDDAKPVALLTLAEAAADAGDPENRLLELRFDRYAGQTVHEKQQKFASTFYGSIETASAVKHSEAILAASERARKRLPALRKAFNAGLQPGETILLKAPFATPDGRNEWMWVEVSSWNGDDIRGLLTNEPIEIPDLHAGATVRISEQKVFDYLHYQADGSEAGNETGKEIQKTRQRE